MSKWKSVYEALPPPEESQDDSAVVLCCNQSPDQWPFTAWYNHLTGDWIVAHYLAASTPVVVSHWRPLPKPPKGETK